MGAPTTKLTLSSFLDLIHQEKPAEPDSSDPRTDVQGLARSIVSELYDEHSSNEANAQRIAAGLAFAAYELLDMERRVRSLNALAAFDGTPREVN